MSVGWNIEWSNRKLARGRARNLGQPRSWLRRLCFGVDLDIQRLLPWHFSLGLLRLNRRRLETRTCFLLLGWNGRSLRGLSGSRTNFLGFLEISLSKRLAGTGVLQWGLDIWRYGNRTVRGKCFLPYLYLVASLTFPYATHSTQDLSHEGLFKATLTLTSRRKLLVHICYLRLTFHWIMESFVVWIFLFSCSTFIR